ncbi:hypothetical protein N0V88_005180 [Collariella sp. IMI 366227]|nr:hypothetical protein N0V88_005180 [Collariella sp. IMI 366227]
MFPRAEEPPDAAELVAAAGLGADVPAYYHAAPLSYFADVLPAADPVGITGHGASAFEAILHGLHARAGGGGTRSNSSNGAVVIPVVSDYADNPWPIFFNASGPANTSITRTSMAYCVKEYRAWPRRWVAETTTPFIHPSLYTGSGPSGKTGSGMASFLGLGSNSLSGLPPALQDAFAVSAVYAARNDANSDLVMQLVESKAAALLYSPDQGNWTIIEQLAALQALLVYQIGVAVSDDATSAWRRWLFNETVRRTVITSFMIRGIYSMAKQGYCRLGPVVTDMSFTSGSRLWAAKTPGRWQRALGETDPGWISRMDFSEILGRADPGNLDEFGVMMAVTYRGKDVVEEWVEREL